MTSIKNVYLDSNASTMADKDVLLGLAQDADSFNGNPSSNHLAGWQTQDAVEAARTNIANELRCVSEEITFTSGASEATTMLFGSLAYGLHQPRRNRIVTTTIEHKTVLENAKAIQSAGFEVNYVPVDSSGRLDMQRLSDSIDDSVILCSIMHGNNEIGVVNPIREIGALCRSKGVLFHSDVAQSFMKEQIDVDEMNIDFLSGSGHKFFAPKGVGFLYHRDGLEINPLIRGGGQEKGLRAGTENTFGIVFMGRVIEKLKKRTASQSDHTGQMRDLFYRSLTELIDDVRLNGPCLSSSVRLRNNLNISIHGVSSVELLKRVQTVQFSTGSACLNTTDASSYVLEAIGMTKQDILSACRFGFSHEVTREEVMFAANQIAQAATDLRKLSA